MMLFRSLQLLVLAAILATGQAAMGHGFQLSLSGNKLVGTGDDFLEAKTTNPTTYSSAWTTVVLGSSYNKGSGGVQPSAAGGLSVPAGDVFWLEFFGPLTYSSGNTAVPATAGVILVANSYVNSTYTLPNLLDSVSLNGSLLLPDTLNVSGNTSHSIQYSLTGSGVPAGVYGFAFRVHGENTITHAAYTASEPLVVLLNTGDFTDPTTVTAARAAVLGVVPEPNTLFLAGCGALALARRLLRREQG